jgi:hypothetical protein
MVGHCSRHLLFSSMRLVAMANPTILPPKREASVPPRDMAPLVPGGTGLSVVIKIGGEWERMPSSEANVSPRQQAKCLQRSLDHQIIKIIF